MQIKIGEKIRELRRRDGRTQEALADALGVTGQAVSRWEANGGYPDMEMLPAIANYFHITIDELFGYDNDREVKLQKICDEADALLNKQEDMDECVSRLRAALTEFPTEARLFIRLAYTLTILGIQKYGTRGKTTDGCDYTQFDVEYNSENIYWREATELFERCFDMDITADDRIAATYVAINLYATIGEYEKARRLANKQDSVVNCREYLLTLSSQGETRDEYLGKAIIAFAKQLKMIVNTAVLSKLSIVKSECGVEKYLGLAKLYEMIFDDGNYGYANGDLCELYMQAAVITARMGDTERALTYFKSAYGHKRKYDEVMLSDEHQYTAPLVSKVTGLKRHWTSAPYGAWEGWFRIIPDNLAAALKADPEYASLFQ